MLLSDGEIWEALESRHIVIDPYPNISGLVQASSVDLRLAGTYWFTEIRLSKE